MSVRLEWTTAQDADPELYEQGEELVDGNTVTAEVALGLGPVVIEGTRREVWAVIEKAYQLLDIDPC